MNSSTLVTKIAFALCVGILLRGADSSAAAAIPPPAADFYVATSGSDTNPGTFDRPFASPARARDAIRPLIAAGLRKDVSVLLRGGTYELAEPLVFGPQDSAPAQHSITYAAYPGERAEISGGRRITGWTQTSGTLWSATIPEVKAGAWFFRQLFADDARRQRARAPNTGYFKIVGDIKGEIKGAPATFQCSSGDIRKEWAERGDVEVIALQAWAELRMPITKITDSFAGLSTVTLAGAAKWYNHESNARYWIENTPDALDAPGEWYLDRTTGILSYISQPRESVLQEDFIAPVLTQLVRFDGDPANQKYVSNIHLSGLVFSYADWSLPAAGYADMQAAFDIPAAIGANGAIGCPIDRCAVTHAGNYAIEFAKGCRQNRVTHCELGDLGAGGVKIGTPNIPASPGEITSGNTVSDCSIHDIGIVYPAGVGVWIGQSNANTISHNHIYNTSYTGISDGWTWGYGPSAAKENVIEYNLIHDIGRGVLSDMGGIYTLGIQPGTILRGNILHDITSYKYGGWGIYTDEGSSGITIENNLVYHTGSTPFNQHYGKGNVVQNNIFALGGEAVVSHGRSQPRAGQFTMAHNILLSNGEPIYLSGYGDTLKSPPYRTDSNLIWDRAGVPVLARGGATSLSLAQWRALGEDQNSVVAEPLFTDPDKGDFSFKAGSPATKIGFQPFDLHSAGPRPGK